MDPLTIVFLAVFGAGYLTGSGGDHAIAKAAKATGHAISRPFHHRKKSGQEKTEATETK